MNNKSILLRTEKEKSRINEPVKTTPYSKKKIPIQNVVQKKVLKKSASMAIYHYSVQKQKDASSLPCRAS